MTSSKPDVNSETSKVTQTKFYTWSGKESIEVRFPGFLQSFSHSMQDCLKKRPSFSVMRQTISLKGIF